MNQVPIKEVEFKAIEKIWPVIDDSREKINELIDAVNRLMAVAPAEDSEV